MRKQEKRKHTIWKKYVKTEVYKIMNKGQNERNRESEKTRSSQKNI